MHLAEEGTKEEEREREERSSQASEQREPLGFIWVLPVGHNLQGHQGFCRLLVHMMALKSHLRSFLSKRMLLLSLRFSLATTKHISLTQLLSTYLVSSKSKGTGGTHRSGEEERPCQHLFILG